MRPGSAADIVDAAGRQGRLDRNWDTAYGVQEAMEAYKRVATQHVGSLLNLRLSSRETRGFS